MNAEREGYRAYLLRLWRVRTESEIAWRASVEDPHTGQRTGFASLDDLLNFLREHTELARDSADDDGERSGGPARTATPQ